MRRIVLLFLVLGWMLAPLSAAARETSLDLSVDEAKNSEIGQARLFSVPFYMKGQEHPPVEKVLSEVTTEQSTRGAFRSDEDSCRVAFLSAIRELQQRAMDKGADAVTDIVSITWDKRTESASTYRCVAGTFVVHVGLKGKIVGLAK